MDLFQESTFTNLSLEGFLNLIYGASIEMALHYSYDIAGDGIYICPEIWTVSLNCQN